MSEKLVEELFYADGLQKIKYVKNNAKVGKETMCVFLEGNKNIYKTRTRKDFSSHRNTGKETFEEAKQNLRLPQAAIRQT